MYDSSSTGEQLTYMIDACVYVDWNRIMRTVGQLQTTAGTKVHIYADCDFSLLPLIA